jgi:glucose-1-phosphate adenylyltransferase
VLILAGDQLYRMDFRHLVAQHVATGAEVTGAATPVPVSRVARLGLLRVAADRSITAFVGRPTDPAVMQGLTLPPALEATCSTVWCYKATHESGSGGQVPRHSAGWYGWIAV